MPLIDTDTQLCSRIPGAHEYDFFGRRLLGLGSLWGLRILVASIVAVGCFALSATAALAETPASTTISGAQVLPASGSVSATESGGNHEIDYWKVNLFGGDQLRLNLTNNASAEEFELYPLPSTTDENFIDNPPVSSASSSNSTIYGANSQVTLQAPYNGTFILAVCQNPSSGDCRSVDTGSVANPMATYNFTTVLLGGGISPAVAAGETQAAPTIAGANPLTLGNFEAGGGDKIDYWQVGLSAGDQMLFSMTNAPYPLEFELYPPGTTDSTFFDTQPVSSASTNDGSIYGALNQATLHAPYTGTFILAICQSPSSGECTSADLTGGVTYPMTPYSFTTFVTLTVDPTESSVVCSPTSVTSGGPTTCTATVTDTAASGATTPTGAVAFSAVPTTGAFGSGGSCALTGSNGVASCVVAFTPSAAGAYSVTASYGGDVTHSASNGQSVTVTASSPAKRSKKASKIAPPPLKADGSVPVARSAPRISGHPAAGGTLSCASGRWSRTPSKITYKWVAEGRPIPGAATKLIRVRTVEEGTRIACITTPYAGAHAGKPVVSRSVYVAVPVVSGCPAASRTLSSLVKLLGLQRSLVAERLAASSDSGQLLEDEFCLIPAGLLVGYPPASLLGSLSGGERGRFAGRVVWVSTANRFYSIAGVGPGTSLSSAKRLLTLTGPYQVGGETWYLARHGRYVVVLIVRGGVVWQLGVSDWPLATGKAAAGGLLKGLGVIYRQSTQISGPLRAVDDYWSAIGRHAFLSATDYVRPGVLGSTAAFVASERKEGVHSAQFEGRVLSESATHARVRIVRLITHDHRYGCRTWHGTYRLARSRAGEWQISQAAITPRSCT